MSSLVVSRSPLRISLGGGGTDLASYYEKFEGFFVSAAINQYVYVTVSRPYKERILLKYSQFEECHSIAEIQHPIIRESLRLIDPDCKQIEISVFADIPAGTGLGSSGSFTTALLKALFVFYRRPISTKELADLACKIEIEVLNEPVGKQDQYIAAFGGITSFHIDKQGNVSVKPIKIRDEVTYSLEENLVLFYTGINRRASDVLAEQVANSSDETVQANLHKVKEQGLKSIQALERGEFDFLAKLLNEQWLLKRERLEKSSSSLIDSAYNLALKSGAIGGKLIGAGGGGFLLFYTRNRSKLISAIEPLGLKHLSIKFDFQGTKVLIP